MVASLCTANADLTLFPCPIRNGAFEFDNLVAAVGLRLHAAAAP